MVHRTQDCAPCNPYAQFETLLVYYTKILLFARSRAPALSSFALTSGKYATTCMTSARDKDINVAYDSVEAP